MASLDLQILNTGPTMMTSSKRRNALVAGHQLEDVMDGIGSVIANMKKN